MEYFLLAIFIFIMSVLIFYCYEAFNRKIRKLPPGPVGVPILGSLHQFGQVLKKRNYLTDLALLDFTKSFGGISYFKWGMAKMVHLGTYEYIKKLIANEDLLARPQDKYLLTRHNGKAIGIGFAEVEHWRPCRRQVTTGLREAGFGNKQHVDSFIQDEFDIFASELNNKLKISNGVLDINSELQGPTMNIIWRFISNNRYEYDNLKFKNTVQVHRQFFQLIDFSGALLASFPFLQWVAPSLSGYKRIEELGIECRKSIKELVQEFKDKGTYLTNPESFIESFLLNIYKLETEGPNPKLPSRIYNEDNLVAVLSDLFAGGSDPLPNFLSFFFMYMILFPNVQNKVRSEIDGAMQDGRWPNGEDASLLPFTEATIMEVHRIVSLTPIIVRVAAKDIKVDEYMIPKGTRVIYNYCAVHHDKSFWKDPETFRPERFLDENGNYVRSERMIPFGGGKRICMGDTLSRNAVFLFATRLIQKYTFEMDPTFGPPTTEPFPGGINKLAKPYNMIVKQRD